MSWPFLLKISDYAPELVHNRCVINLSGMEILKTKNLTHSSEKFKKFWIENFNFHTFSMILFKKGYANF